MLNQYKIQKTAIEINRLKMEAKISKGCPLSPFMFNLFTEKAIERMKEKTKELKLMGKT